MATFTHLSGRRRGSNSLGQRNLVEGKEKLAYRCGPWLLGDMTTIYFLVDPATWAISLSKAAISAPQIRREIVARIKQGCRRTSAVDRGEVGGYLLQDGKARTRIGIQGGIRLAGRSQEPRSQDPEGAERMQSPLLDRTRNPHAASRSDEAVEVPTASPDTRSLGIRTGLPVHFIRTGSLNEQEATTWEKLADALHSYVDTLPIPDPMGAIPFEENV